MAGLRAMPGVDAVGETFVLPLVNNNSTGSVWMDGVSPEQARQASFNRVSRGYFDALGMRLLGGRGDPRHRYDRVAVRRRRQRDVRPHVRARRESGGPTVPRGRIARLPGTGLRDRRARGRCGVPACCATDRGPSRSSRCAARRLEQRRHLPRSWSVTTPPAFNSALRGSARPRASEAALLGAQPRGRGPPGHASRSRDGDPLVLLWPAGALLAAVGLHGVVLYAVERRRREIGIRLALGASPGAVVGSVSAERHTGRRGSPIGFRPLSLALTGAARTLLFGLEPRGSGTRPWPSARWRSSRSISSLMPAQRAARVDPMSTLKDE